jgi:hypothetical protein
MTVYMLRETELGLYYRRTKGNYSPTVWVEQEKASVWVTKNGPAQVISRQRENRKQYFEIVPFELVEKP